MAQDFDETEYKGNHKTYNGAFRAGQMQGARDVAKFTSDFISRGGDNKGLKIHYNEKAVHPGEPLPPHLR